MIVIPDLRSPESWLVVGPWIVGATFLGGLAVQVGVVLVTGNDPRIPSEVSDVAGLYQVRVVESALLGDRAVREMWPRWGLTPAIGLTVLAAIAATVAVTKLGVGRCRLAIVAVGMSVVLYGLPVYFRGSSEIRLLDGVFNNFGARYAVVPVLLLVSAAAMLCAQSEKRWVPMVLAAQIALVSLISLGDVHNRRPGGPSWVEGVHQAEKDCTAAAAQGNDDASASIPISPTVSPTLGWHAELPCDRIRS